MGGRGIVGQTHFPPAGCWGVVLGQGRARDEGHFEGKIEKWEE